MLINSRRNRCRFEKLNLDCLNLNERYLEALEMFQNEIGDLRDRYNEERQNPLVPRNMPPVAGRIMWIRQLYARIEEPMNIFKTKCKVSYYLLVTYFAFFTMPCYIHTYIHTHIHTICFKLNAGM